MDFFRKTIRDPAVLQRMEVAFDLCETAEVMMRQNLRRRHPDLEDAEIEELLGQWRLRRPGAEHGDGVGRPVPKDRIEKWLDSERA